MDGIAALTDKGLSRETNQDACCVLVAQTLLGPLSMAAVCDGVGGLWRGELASSYVVQRFVGWFKSELPHLIRFDENEFSVGLLDIAWDTLLGSAHESLCTYGKRVGKTSATTFTGVLACNGRYLVAQVGDSRLYIRNREGFRQITQDQTPSSWMPQNVLLEDREQGNGQSHLILQAIGAGESIRPCFTAGTYDSHDLFVLCTDGAYRPLGSAGVQRCFQHANAQYKGSLNESCKLLVDEAIRLGATDNLSVSCFFGQSVHAGDHGTLVFGGDEAW